MNSVSYSGQNQGKRQKQAAALRWDLRASRGNKGESLTEPSSNANLDAP